MVCKFLGRDLDKSEVYKKDCWTGFGGMPHKNYEGVGLSISFYVV